MNEYFKLGFVHQLNDSEGVFVKIDKKYKKK